MSGVLLYVNHDYKFSVQAYLWIGVWYVVSIFELIYVKHLVTTSNMTTWGRARDSLSFPFYSPPSPILPFSFTSSVSLTSYPPSPRLPQKKMENMHCSF